MDSMLFRVDSEKCLKCGLCVKDCAFRVITTGDDGMPVMKRPDKCMRCQHCFAICPTGAITFDGISSNEAILSSEAHLPDAVQVEHWMKTRRSVRSFSDEDVDPEVLDKVLNLLGNSPTGCNAHALTFTCYPNRAAMDKFRKAVLSAIEEHRGETALLPRWLAIPAINLRNGKDDLFFRGATGILIVSCDEKAYSVTTPSEDVTVACSNFELLANANGISTCWCGFLKIIQNEIPELLEKVVGIRRSTPFYAMLFGKSNVKYVRGVERGAYAKIEYKR
ncbi:MAG: nitroreductase family protein [Kiritimatiellae bacterium]|nr:nitroreductase family protein [Kiritimatiellia bacterium]